MKPLVIFLPALLLTACDAQQLDQCLRREIFKECMMVLPKGPERVHNSNDWSEVVDSCHSSATYQSYRKESQIKMECRSW